MPSDFTDDDSSVQFKEWLGAVWQQAITWASIDPDLCYHVAWLGHNELMTN